MNTIMPTKSIYVALLAAAALAAGACGPFRMRIDDVSEQVVPAPPIESEVYERAEMERIEFYEREVERLHADLRQAEESLVAMESGLRGFQSRADAVSAVAEARIALERVGPRVPWRHEQVSEARGKLEEASRQIEEGHVGSAVFFASRAHRITESLREEAGQVDAWQDKRIVLGVMAPNMGALMAVWFALGAGASLIQTPAGRLLMRSSRAADRPAIYSAQFALSHACWLIAYPLAGWLGAAAGLSAAFTVLAVLALMATGAALILWPADDSTELEHRHDAMEHEHPHVYDEHHRHAHDGWEGPEPHRHPHRHAPLKHKHPFVIDLHHMIWPRG